MRFRRAESAPISLEHAEELNRFCVNYRTFVLACVEAEELRRRNPHLVTASVALLPSVRIAAFHMVQAANSVLDRNEEMAKLVGNGLKEMLAAREGGASIESLRDKFMSEPFYSNLFYAVYAESVGAVYSQIKRKGMTMPPRERIEAIAANSAQRYMERLTNPALPGRSPLGYFMDYMKDKGKSGNPYFYVVKEGIEAAADNELNIWMNEVKSSGGSLDQNVGGKDGEGRALGDIVADANGDVHQKYLEENEEIDRTEFTDKLMALMTDKLKYLGSNLDDLKAAKVKPEDDKFIAAQLDFDQYKDELEPIVDKMVELVEQIDDAMRAQDRPLEKALSDQWDVEYNKFLLIGRAFEQMTGKADRANSRLRLQRFNGGKAIEELCKKKHYTDEQRDQLYAELDAKMTAKEPTPEERAQDAANRAKEAQYIKDGVRPEGRPKIGPFTEKGFLKKLSATTDRLIPYLYLSFSYPQSTAPELGYRFTTRLVTPYPDGIDQAIGTPENLVALLSENPQARAKLDPLAIWYDTVIRGVAFAMNTRNLHMAFRIPGGQEAGELENNFEIFVRERIANDPALAPYKDEILKPVGGWLKLCTRGQKLSKHTLSPGQAGGTTPFRNCLKRMCGWLQAAAMEEARLNVSNIPSALKAAELAASIDLQGAKKNPEHVGKSWVEVLSNPKERAEIEQSVVDLFKDRWIAKLIGENNFPAGYRFQHVLHYKTPLDDIAKLVHIECGRLLSIKRNDPDQAQRWHIINQLDDAMLASENIMLNIVGLRKSSNNMDAKYRKINEARAKKGLKPIEEGDPIEDVDAEDVMDDMEAEETEVSNPVAAPVTSVTPLAPPPTQIVSPSAPPEKTLTPPVVSAPARPVAPAPIAATPVRTRADLSALRGLRGNDLRARLFGTDYKPPTRIFEDVADDDDDVTARTRSRIRTAARALAIRARKAEARGNYRLADEIDLVIRKLAR